MDVLDVEGLKLILEDFWQSYVIETGHGLFRVIKTMTYGEMVISFFLLCILLVLVFRWVYDILRW